MSLELAVAQLSEMLIKERSTRGQQHDLAEVTRIIGVVRHAFAMRLDDLPRMAISEVDISRRERDRVYASILRDVEASDAGFFEFPAIAGYDHPADKLRFSLKPAIESPNVTIGGEDAR